MPAQDILLLLLLGLVSGALGGLLGIGGSVVMIPVLAIVLGPNQHLYQAAAMVVNVFVALPATLRHHRAKAIRWDAVLRMTPAAVIMIVIGVAASNRFDGRDLQRVFGAFLLYVITVNIIRLRDGTPEPPPADQHVNWGTAGGVGGFMGFMAGLLGIGGGIITVPLLQRVCRMPLRDCIACSSTAMCLTAVIGAFRKNMTLPDHGIEIAESLTIAACMAPTAIVGGLLGASLVHVLPLRFIRLAFIVLLCLAAYRLFTA